jgi:hypothetical protein
MPLIYIVLRADVRPGTFVVEGSASYIKQPDLAKGCGLRTVPTQSVYKALISCTQLDRINCQPQVAF